MAPTTESGNKYYMVVVADEAHAIVYARDRRRAPLRELNRFENEAARARTEDLISDRGGRSFDSHGQGRHTMASEKGDPKQHLAEVFARQLADHIAAELHKGTCAAFALVAAPKFLGSLRGQLATRVHVEPFAAVAKNVVGHAEDKIARLLDES